MAVPTTTLTGPRSAELDSLQKAIDSRSTWTELRGPLTADLVAPVADAKRLADRHTSIPDQLTLAEFIRSGAYDRHVRRRRLAYRRRRDELISTLGSAMVEGISAGLHALVNLPDGLTETDAIARAAASGLAIEGLGRYRIGAASHRPGLVVGYATPPEHAYRTTLTLLRQALNNPHQQFASVRARHTPPTVLGQ